ncbi:MAG: integrase/recombinase XerD [Gammaproteobacteria bacterium]|jgi:integrase/recombinase XerD
MINSSRELRDQTFILTGYSLSLWLGETLDLRVGDIDSEHMKYNIRLGRVKKGGFSLRNVGPLQNMHTPHPGG